MTPIAIHEKAVQNTFYKIQREGIKSLAITSARRGEGVTAFSYALARRAATAGVRVLLIDLNLAHPAQSETLALEQKDWSPSENIDTTAIKQISSTNLAVLSAPQKVRDTWPFQDQAKMQKMLASLQHDYDLIIADMPSVLERDTELQVEILCAAFDATLIMALSSKAIETEMIEMKKTLDEANVKLIGAVMNDKFTPSLADQLKRQLEKFEPRLSRITGLFKRWIDGNAFLNQNL